MESVRGFVPAAGIVALGLVLAGATLWHAGAHTPLTLTTALSTGAFVAVAIGIVVAGAQVVRNATPTGDRWRLLGWAVGGTVATAALGTVLFAHLDALAVVRDEQLFFLTTTSGSGAAAGITLGWGELRSRRRAKETAASEQRLRAVFENTLDALVLTDDEGRYVAANEAAADLFGLPRVDLLGKRVNDFAAPGLDVEAAWSEFLTNGSQRGTFPLQRPDGETRTVEFAATRDVSPGRHLSALRDVTERERSQRRAEGQQEQLSFLNRMLRHHVRNNLQVVVAEAERLDAAGDGSAGVLLDRVAAIELLLDQVGQFTTSLTRDEPLHAVDIRAVLTDATDTVRATAPAAEIEIGELPDATVVADALVTDVFLNLLVNAVHHNDVETPRIHVSGVADEETVTITVADDGPGIDDERKACIFEWSDGPADDLGFGLYLTKALMAHYGGQVWVDDAQELGGAAFSVQLRRGIHDVLTARDEPVANSL